MNTEKRFYNFGFFSFLGVLPALGNFKFSLSMKIKMMGKNTREASNFTQPIIQFHIPTTLFHAFSFLYFRTGIR